MRYKLLLPLLLVGCFQTSSAQNIKATKMYEIQPGESIIMANEHRLAIHNGKAHYLLFLQKGKEKYIVFDQKKHGPFEEIKEWESYEQILDWGVKKDGQWYQLLLDYNKMIGPFDEVYEVTRDHSDVNFGFKAVRDSSWYMVINDKLFGPYADINTGPLFTPNGNNWSFEYYVKVNGKMQHFVKYKNEEINANSIHYQWAGLIDDGYDYYQVVSTNKTYNHGSAVSQITADNSIWYFMKNQPEISLEDEWETGGGGISTTSPHLDFGFLGHKSVYAFITDEKFLVDKNGVRNGPFNEITTYGCWNGSKYAILKNYTVNESGKISPVYQNADPKKFDSFSVNLLIPDEDPDRYIPEAKIIRQKFLLLNNVTYGPFEDITDYSLEIARNGQFLCLVNADRELFVNGNFTGIKHIHTIRYNYDSGQFLAISDDNTLYWNLKKVGKFNIDNKYGDIQFSSDGQHYAILHTAKRQKYIYLSGLGKSIGPIKSSKKIVSWQMSEDGKHAAFTNGILGVDEENAVDRNAFSLTYSSDSNSFSWLTLKGKEIIKKEYIVEK